MNTPSFNTVNVARWYTLRYQVGLECAKKYQEFEGLVNRRDFKVFPPFCRPVTVLYAPVAPSGDASQAVDLPSYGEALQSK